VFYGGFLSETFLFKKPFFSFFNSQKLKKTYFDKESRFVEDSFLPSMLTPYMVKVIKFKNLIMGFVFSKVIPRTKKKSIF